MIPHRINMLSFEDKVIKSDIPVLIAFGAVWDFKSRLLFSHMTWYAKTFDHRMLVAIADLDIVPEVFSRMEIYDIPAFMILEDGKPFDRQVGYNDARDIDRMLYKFFGYLPYDAKNNLI